MTRRGKTRRLTLGWRKFLLGLSCAGVAAAGVCLARGPLGLTTVQVVAADPAPTSPSPSSASTVPPSPTNEYSSSPVAVFGDGKSVTREELGEYLIARYGDKVENLVHRRIIEDECKRRNIEVTAKEVDEKLADDLRDLNIDRARFVKDFLKARSLTLYEWKEDHLRLELMMMKLCGDQLVVSDEEVRNAYVARYGEKVECRVIEWSLGVEPKTPEEKDKALEELKTAAYAAYAQIVNNEEAFAAAARRQRNDALAAGGGKIKPFGRHTLENQDLEEQAFALRPGQVSPLIPIPETGGFVIIKCDRRIPADTTTPLEKVSADLAKDVHERKAQKLFKALFNAMQEKADVHFEITLHATEDHPFGYDREAKPGQAKNSPVATLYNKQVTLTREDLGEYLIQRYGATNVELLVNRRIIENACQASNITVAETEVETEFNLDWAKKKMKDRDQFIKEYLVPNKLSVFQYKEDIVRPRLMLTKLCRDHVKVEDKDFADAYDAYYGEKVKCRMILWPPGEENTKLVLQEWGQIRDNPQAFEEKARQQASRTLANNAGLLDDPIGHHTTGNDKLEQEAFALQEGQVSSVIETKDGLVVLRCEQRIPAQQVNPAEVRDKLMQEILEKKTQAEMPVYFRQLQKAANPQILIAGPPKHEDLTEEVTNDLHKQK